MTAPVGLHGELMITPRVRSVAAASMPSNVGRNCVRASRLREDRRAAGELRPGRES